MSDEPIKIIMIEDDEDITNLLTQNLERYNMKVTGFELPLDALQHLETNKYDLLILDLSLPQMDGMEVFKNVRSQSEMPVIISSARSDLNDKVNALELGADDYLPKPYDPRELVARIKTVLRRKKATNNEKSIGLFSVDEAQMQISFKDLPLQLTPAEYSILLLMIQNTNKVVSREMIIDGADSISYDSSDRSIDVIISRLRHKIEIDTKKPEFIKSVRGIGYKLIT